MNTVTIDAQVHRFRDLVGIALHSGPTIYLTPEDTQKLCQAIVKVQHSIENDSFVNSKDTTTRMVFEGKV